MAPWPGGGGQGGHGPHEKKLSDNFDACRKFFKFMFVACKGFRASKESIACKGFQPLDGDRTKKHLRICVLQAQRTC